MILNIKIFFYPAWYYARQLAKKIICRGIKNDKGIKFDSTSMNKPEC